MINIAMVNDLHYWGIRRIQEPCFAVVPDTGDFLAHRMQVPGASEGGQANVDDADDDGPEADSSTNPTEVVEMELSLCTMLSEWNPWVTPDADVIHHLQSMFP